MRPQRTTTLTPRTPIPAVCPRTSHPASRPLSQPPPYAHAIARPATPSSNLATVGIVSIEPLPYPPSYIPPLRVRILTGLAKFFAFFYPKCVVAKVAWTAALFAVYTLLIFELGRGEAGMVKVLAPCFLDVCVLTACVMWGEGEERRSEAKRWGGSGMV